MFLSCFCILYVDVKAQTSNSVREQIQLAGSWQLKLDPSNAGLKTNWQDSTFKEEIKLPGSLEENKKGKRVEKASSKYLNQTFQYTGAAWYQKEIDVPASWANKHVELFLERTKVTQVWIDGKPIGRSTLLSAPQVYDLTTTLTPGKHVLTIMVDNSHHLVSVGGSHALSEHTQTNWNGIIGKMYLEASEKLRIDWVRVDPDIKNKVANAQVKISSLAGEKFKVELQASAFNSKNEHQVKPLTFKIKTEGRDSVFQFFYPLGEDALLWDEYNPSLYKLTVSLLDKRQIKDNVSTSFGLRDFKAAGTQFSINDVITFLRGKNDGCIFPLTGYSPMETAAWQKLYRIAKSYGINHYRFHSYTPPAAAFEAADLEGIYIQSELPLWANFTLKDTVQVNFQSREGRAILDAYGNHASFVMFSLGNELAGDSSIHNKLVRDFRAYDDDRRLYAYGTNAFYADPKPGATDDFWVTMRTGKESSKSEFDVRGSFATTEDGENGILNAWEPSTHYNFSQGIKGLKLPVVGHETGQFQIYPDYTEMPRYTGVLRPLNFGIFKKRLEDAGMGDQATDFFKASGKLTALLYREEIEMAFRTPGFAGFQLLDLQDYPGQGTALVGLLNAFMENKGIITAEDFKKFNNDVVIQLLMDKYVWANDQTYAADVQLVNYSPADISNKKLNWIALTEENKEIARGTLAVDLVQKAKINSVGKISIPLQNLTKASKLLIKLELADSPYKIEYPIWVYPNTLNTNSTSVKVTTKLDENTIEELNNGGRVLLFPDHEVIKDRSVGPQFISEFWNWLVFKGAATNMTRPVSAGTLGILTNPKHPIFNDFPTDFHTNWQWWSITKNARPFILDNTESGYHPIVQVIDNIDRN
ncbi:MAG: sugar-binding domain-containing protein, partial [Sphingobacteriaceae bacterium]